MNLPEPENSPFVDQNAPRLGDWQPTATIEVLRQRAMFLQTVRQFFGARGYWEVETPLLSQETCIDTWIDPIEVPDPLQPQRRLYLQTSPEFAMKRLLAAGAEAIFQITRSFRGGEAGDRHNPEFTIVEWYRVGDTHHEQMTLTEELVRSIARTNIGAAPKVLPDSPFPRITYEAAFESALGTTIHDKSARQLRHLVEERNVSIPRSLDADDLDGWRNLLLAEAVEPWLAKQPAVFLYDYPASQAALAKVRSGPPAVAERFELYLDGVELCNGYNELTDPVELRMRMQRHHDCRVANGQPSLPVESRLLAAMHHGLPPCAGVALGFDRLAMWRLGCSLLRDVTAFPFDRA